MGEGVLEGETERKLGGCIWKGEGKILIGIGGV